MKSAEKKFTISLCDIKLNHTIHACIELFLSTTITCLLIIISTSYLLSNYLFHSHFLRSAYNSLILEISSLLEMFLLSLLLCLQGLILNTNIKQKDFLSRWSVCDSDKQTLHKHKNWIMLFFLEFNSRLD